MRVLMAGIFLLFTLAQGAPSMAAGFRCHNQSPITHSYSANTSLDRVTALAAVGSAAVAYLGAPHLSDEEPNCPCNDHAGICPCCATHCAHSSIGFVPRASTAAPVGLQSVSSWVIYRTFRDGLSGLPDERPPRLI